MRLVILEDGERVAEWAARYIIKRINDFKPGADNFFVLGLSTGTTPLRTYQKLVQYHKAGKISFKFVKTFNMDEFVGVPRDHSRNCHTYMWQNLFNHIDIDPANIHMLDGNAASLEEECQKYEDKIKKAGGIELLVAGVGTDGHIAFNEPGSSLVSRTRVKTLSQGTITANAFKSKVSKQALTVGVGTLMDAREVMLMMTGSHKAYAIHMAIEEGVNHMWPVSAFQQHPRTTILCDEDATLELKVKTVKYFKDLWTVHQMMIDDHMMPSFS